MRMRGGRTPSMACSSTTIFLTSPLRSGRVNIVSSSASSATARKPRAPVPRAMAFFGDGAHRGGRDFEIRAFHLKNASVLARERVFGLVKNPHQRLLVEFV